jgi:hypothetical protein
LFALAVTDSTIRPCAIFTRSPRGKPQSAIFFASSMTASEIREARLHFGWLEHPRRRSGRVCGKRSSGRRSSASCVNPPSAGGIGSWNDSTGARPRSDQASCSLIPNRLRSLIGRTFSARSLFVRNLELCFASWLTRLPENLRAIIAPGFFDAHCLHCHELPVIRLWISAPSVLKFRVQAGVPRHR